MAFEEDSIVLMLPRVEDRLLLSCPGFSKETGTMTRPVDDLEAWADCFFLYTFCFFFWAFLVVMGRLVSILTVSVLSPDCITVVRRS